jgi:hypothetical protein
VIRAAVWGTGRAGTELVRAGVQRPWIEFVAGIVFDPAKEGRDLGEIAGIESLGAPVTTDAASVLARGDIDLVFYAGLGDEAAVGERMLQIVNSGKDAVTVSGLIHPRSAIGDEAAGRLEEACVANGVHAIGAGVNPGFLLDVLPVTWMSHVVSYKTVTARRVSDMKTWGPGVHKENGIGLPMAEVGNRKTAMALDHSLALIGDALGLTFDRIDNTTEQIESTIHREYRDTVVEPGTLCGFRRRCAGVVGGEGRVVLEWTAIFDLNPQVDGLSPEGLVIVDGDPWLETHFKGGVFDDPYPATAARGLSVVQGVRAMPPGLYDSAQVPFAVRPG